MVDVQQRSHETKVRLYDLESQSIFIRSRSKRCVCLFWTCHIPSHLALRRPASLGHLNEKSCPANDLRQPGRESLSSVASRDQPTGIGLEICFAPTPSPPGMVSKLLPYPSCRGSLAVKCFCYIEHGSQWSLRVTGEAVVSRQH